MDQTVKISRCLNGDQERHCNWCECHHSKNGKCCFGVRHEFNHPDCNACVLNQDCAALTHDLRQQQAQPYRQQYYQPTYQNPAPPRPIYTQQPQPPVPAGHAVRVTSAKPPAMSNYGPQPGEPLLVPAPIKPRPLELNPDDNLFVRFLKVSSWGAGEGFFEMAVNFFRIRRPE
jgi:hypothetical protein